jgi:translation initiation factor 1A
MLGNGKVEANCFDGRKRICNIRGKMRKKVEDIKFRCG